MILIKRVLLIIVLIVLLSITIYLLNSYYNHNNIRKAIKNNEITIDKDIHNWQIQKDKLLKIEMFLRNNSQIKIEGNLIFIVALSKQGLEEAFIKEIISEYGSEVIKELAQEKMEGNEHIIAINNYISRGNKLKIGTEFESLKIIDKKHESNYIFKFRKYISIKSGEIVRLTHEQEMPLSESGQLFSVKIDDIEF